MVTLILYIITASFEKRNQNTQFEIHNYKEIINYIKSISMSDKPKIDPKMIITSEPIAVKQSDTTSKPEETKIITIPTKKKE